ncbi:MAG TPA: DNA mismatch repair endonuclease MutL [Mariprofundaceae bacterium]|nr:DNA mismatch repair endonuclease MutL [Mariprofundaceae bacterium]
MPEQTVHLLPPEVANQIAAGEVVERPASVVKELVENSLDAGAVHIRVRIEQAGKRLIEVDDDGCGMSDVDARLALQRHATSKISRAADLAAIASHGFRGEALPSIASVSRLELHTCLPESSAGLLLQAEGAAPEERPAPPRKGTRIRIRDIFFNTPARQRFLRTDRTEEAAVVESMRSLALANHATGMRLELDGRRRFDMPAGQSRAGRIAAVMGQEFGDNSIECALEHEGILVAGHFGLPTFHYRDGSRMLFFINGRVVRDRQLIAALKAGYRDVLFHDRFPQAVVWLEMDPADVDVNVHPTKREVRFKSPQTVRAALVSCARAAIERMGQQVSSLSTDQAMQAMRAPASSSGPDRRPSPAFSPAAMQGLFDAAYASEPTRDYSVASPNRSVADASLDLGRPLTQIHRCYILAQTDEGIVLVDQHAAHERIRYEEAKAQLQRNGIAMQMLLTPLGFRLSGRAAAWLHDHDGALSVFGVEVEAAGEESFTIRAVPAMLADESPEGLVAELVEASMLIGVDAEGRGRVLERWLGNRACKGSIKSGRLLGSEEQEALLRRMERTPNIAQCNHGRPTYVRLGLGDLERLFGRKE